MYSYLVIFVLLYKGLICVACGPHYQFYGFDQPHLRVLMPCNVQVAFKIDSLTVSK